MHDKLPNIECKQQLYCMTYTNIYMQIPVYDAQMYQYKQIYNACVME